MDSQLEKRTITTTDNYSTTLDAIQKQGTKTATVVVRNTGAKAAKFKVEGSVDGTNWVDVVAEAELASAGTAKASITDYWPFLRVNGKAKESGQQTTLQVAVASVAV